MGDGTRIEGARAKGKAAAAKQKDSGKPSKGNPYGAQRPGMKQAWQEAFDAELSGEPTPVKAPKPKGKPGRKPKVKPSPEPVTVDEPIETMPADEPEYMAISDNPHED